MRKLILLRGIPASGKSTFIKNNKLEKYTVSSDNIRLLYNAPKTNILGEEYITQDKNRKVWKLIFELVESRMRDGETTIVDATHLSNKTLKRYVQLANKYRYDINVVSFEEKLEICIQRDKNRGYRRVGLEVINKMYDSFLNQEKLSGITYLTPDEFIESTHIKPVEIKKYKRIAHIGDIHGCYSALKELIKEIDEDTLYIFLGDYHDRGIENGQVLNFILENYKRENFIFLRGNHEIHLERWSNDEKSYSDDFEHYTKKQLEGFSKVEVKNFIKTLKPYFYYKFKDKTIFCCHGGISTLKNLYFKSEEELVKGVGKYEDSYHVDKTFDKNHKLITQIHGHRNIDYLPIEENFIKFKSLNLEGKVEFGKELRAVILTDKGFKSRVVNNKIFKKDKISNVKDLIFTLSNNDYIKEKDLGDNIFSYNFTREVFKKRIWDKETVKARGLFINKKINKIVNRAYDKFFNINEMEETTLKNLENNLVFPLRAYVKYNGYLGLVGYNEENNELVFSSKSSTNSSHAQWLKEIFYRTLAEHNICPLRVKDYLRENNVNLVFEVCDGVNDEHIIDLHNTREIYLLDIVKREITYKALPREQVKEFAKEKGFKIKELFHTFWDFTDFKKWYEVVSKNDIDFDEGHIEGFVLEAEDGFKFKIKLPFYNRWKTLRTMQSLIIKDVPINCCGLDNEQLEVIEFMKNLHKNNELKDKHICEIRRMYFNTRY